MTEQPKEYVISHFQAGDYKDSNGNTWCNVLFEGRQNEPIRWVVKDPSAFSVGQTVYGHVETKTSQAGKDYLRFYRDQKPPDEPQGRTGGSSWQPRDDMAIRAQWAIGQAVAWSIGNDLDKIGDLEGIAKNFFVMVDRVKASTIGPVPKITNEPPDDDAEMQSMMEAGLRADGIVPEDYR